MKNQEIQNLESGTGTGARTGTGQINELLRLGSMIDINIPPTFSALVGGVVASWLVRLSPDRTVQAHALVRDIPLCSWARHFTLTVPLSAQVYNWVPANLMLGVTLQWTSIPSRGEYS